jgi:alpha-D-ribose 1-methylphosphonate 5-triphosphate synthase subunit PhnG
MAELARIVEEGGAVTARLESGAIELRLATGEIFHLGEETVTRIA